MSDIANIIDVQSEDELNQLITKGSVIVDFHAGWCGPCKAMKPSLDQLAKQQPGLTIAKVDIDLLTDIAVNYQIRGVPTLLVFDTKASQVSRVVGGQNLSALQDLASKALA